MDILNINNAINNYYKLKEKYDDKLNQTKYKIINNPALTSEEKKIKFNQVKKLCINCKKEGGTIFTNKDGILKARCGNISNPCNLNIEIKKGKYQLSDNLIEILRENLDKIKIKIIKIKLDHLFGYTSESEALEKFNYLKEKLVKENTFYQKVEIFYINKTNNPNINDLLTQAEYDLVKEIEQFKEYCKVFNISKNSGIIKTAVETYISTIQPLLDNIVKFKYTYRNIEKINDINYLIEKKNTLESLEYTIENGKIINNKK